MRSKRSRLKIFSLANPTLSLLRKEIDSRNKPRMLLRLRRMRNSSRIREKLNFRPRSMRPETELVSRRRKSLRLRLKKVQLLTLISNRQL